MSEPSLVDGFGRFHRSLRLSVTDRCNLRCRYCMPAEGMKWLPREELLTDEELLRLVALFARLGVTEIRVTGGEPLVRPGLPALIGRVVATPVDVGQFVKSGSVLVRLQGIDAGLRLDEARAAVTRAEASVKLAESQNTLAQTTAQRYASLLATGDVSSTVADQARTTAETSVQNVNTARASLA